MIVEVGGMDSFSVLGAVRLEGCVFSAAASCGSQIGVRMLGSFFYVLTTVGPK